MTVDAQMAPGFATPKLRLDALSHEFRSRNAAPVQAISNISLDVKRGSFVSLIGQSGCGKSTLFNILAGLLTPSSGRVVLDGSDITGRAGLVSYMLQKDLLLPWRTVLDNVIYGLEIQGMDRREARAVAEPLMDRYGLGKC
jgi:ABC-type nitrate/sulfonate/bicarbonate transport system ATPase subunit